MLPLLRTRTLCIITMYGACDLYYALNFNFPVTAVTGVSSLQLLCATSSRAPTRALQKPQTPQFLSESSSNPLYRSLFYDNVCHIDCYVQNMMWFLYCGANWIPGNAVSVSSLSVFVTCFTENSEQFSHLCYC